MIIKSVKNLKFKDELGTYQHIGRNHLALYVEGKGFISLDGGKTVYVPVGGRKALKAILESGFCGKVDYIQPVA